VSRREKVQERGRSTMTAITTPTIHQKCYQQLPSPAASSCTSIISTSSLFDHPLDPPPHSIAVDSSFVIQQRSGGGYQLKVNQRSLDSITTGLVASTCSPSPVRSRARSDVVSLLFLNCATRLLDRSGNHPSSKDTKTNNSDRRGGTATATAPLPPPPPPAQLPLSFTSSNNNTARFASRIPRDSLSSLSPPAIEEERVIISGHHFQTVGPPLSSPLLLSTHQGQSRVLPSNGLLVPTSRQTSSLSQHHQYQKTFQKSGGTTTSTNSPRISPSTPTIPVTDDDFEAEIKLHIDRFYSQDLARSILVEQKLHIRRPNHIATWSSSSTTTASDTTTCSSSSSRNSKSTGGSTNSKNDCASSSSSLSTRTSPRPSQPRQLVSILQQSGRCRQSKNTMRHISWQDDQAAVAAAKKVAAATATTRASSVASSTTSSSSSSSLYVPSITTSIARESSTSSSSASTNNNSDKENGSSSRLLKDNAISRYTPRNTNTTPTSLSSSSSSVAATSTTSSTLYNNVQNNNSSISKPQFILEPSDLWTGAVRFDPQQIQELFVEMCFFARLGFVQPPCCLQCTYRDCNDTSPTPTNNQQQHHRHHHPVATSSNSNNKHHNTARSCQRWVVWRKDANTLLHPNLLDGNVLIVQCQAAQRLLAGHQVDGCYWDAENKQVKRGAEAPTKAAAAPPPRPPPPSRR
jgi:hypothetical protein